MCDPTELTFGCFNLLADGLSGGEFLCEGGDLTTEWANRRDKLCSVLGNMLENCAVVVTVENDHFYYLLNEIRKYDASICGLWGTNISRSSTARQLKLARQCSLAGIDPQEESNVYQCLNLAIRRGEITEAAGTSYAVECGRYAAVMASAFGDQPEDFYQSNDGIGIYYRSDLLELVETSIPGSEACHVVDGDDTKIVTNMNYTVRATFRTKGDGSLGKEITVYGAHLKSGEGYEKERMRCMQLRTILEDAQHRANPVVLMDSNNSVHYEAKYVYDQLASSHPMNVHHDSLDSRDSRCEIETLSSVMAQYHMVDAVGLPYQTMGNECFKMRHGRGGQPAKHFQLMFDAIDKILVPHTAIILPIAYERCRFGFERYDPAHLDALLRLRTSSSSRRELEHHCRTTARIVDATCAVQAFGADHVLAGLYPNPRAPSDHPPVVCSVAF